MSFSWIKILPILVFVSESSSRVLEQHHFVDVSQLTKSGNYFVGCRIPPHHKSRIYSSEVCTQQRHLSSPVLILQSFLRSKFFLLATVCDTIGIKRRSIKTVEHFITRCKTNGIVAVYTGAVIDMGRNMENCFRKMYWSLIIKARFYISKEIDWNAHHYNNPCHHILNALIR